MTVKEIPAVAERVTALIDEALSFFPDMEGAEYFRTRSVRSLEKHGDTLTFEKAIDQTVARALEEIDRTDGRPNWTFVASRLFAAKLYKEAADNRGYNAEDKYGSLYELIVQLTEIGMYDPALLASYTKEELDEVGSYIVPERDYDFTYIGLRTLSDKYLARAYTKQAYELPQERLAIIALALMIKEAPEVRLAHIKEFYRILSLRYMTVATPTYANAGKNDGQLSSCFIDMVGDDLKAIYDSNTDVAELSKYGGGIGVYMGKVRSRGSSIRNHPGASSGVLPWIKQLNNTAVSVDQLGQRQGAIAVYLDIWHNDIFGFLDLKLNNGDERLRAHDIFTGVCLPDVFMEEVDKRGTWYTFDPYTIEKVLGFRLEDHYDEKRGYGTFRMLYQVAVNAAEEGKLGAQGLLWEKHEAIEVMKRIMRSQMENGVPFMFYRDEANRRNPNKHEGMIYSSNLCTEIFQNLSLTTIKEHKLTEGDELIITTKKPGDMVVCNLSSLNLGEIFKQEGDNFLDVIRTVIKTQVRALDNAIDLNRLPVLQAEATNRRYRGIGLGTFGWHHLLALKGIKWHQDAAVDLSDEVYEAIGHATIEASMELAKEKGAYPLFEGSDWQTGAYFEQRDYVTENGDNTDSVRQDWSTLKRDVAENGIRNANLMAVAPNATTSIIAGSTASIDPIFMQSYSEEKKDYKIPVTAPDLNGFTTWQYQTAFLLNQHDSIRQNAVRQRHVDQGISLNLYLQNGAKAKDLLALHLDAWASGMKSTYYVRTTTQPIGNQCESCSS